MLGVLFLVAEGRYHFRVVLCRLGNKGKVGSARERWPPDKDRKKGLDSLDLWFVVSRLSHQKC